MVPYCIVFLTKQNIIWKTVLSGNYAIFIISYTTIIIIITTTIIIIINNSNNILIIIIRRRTLKDTFQDILDKCATVNVVRGKIVQWTNVNLNNDK